MYKNTLHEVYNNISVKIINLKRIMLRHRIYGSIKFCLSRPARCFHFDLTLISYAQTSLRAAMHRNNDRPTHYLFKMNTIFFTFDFIQTEYVLSQTGNKSRRLRLVLVFFCCPRNDRERYSHIHKS